MPYRVKSTDVWFNLPGVVAAYQPVACPGGPLLASANIGNEQRRPAVYTAVPGVAPTFDPRLGWTFDGSTQRLNTNVIPVKQKWTMLARMVSLGSTGWGCPINAYTFDAGAENRFGWQTVYGSATVLYSMSGGSYNASLGSAGVFAVAGAKAYLNGIYLGSIGDSAGSIRNGIVLGNDSSGTRPCNVIIGAVSIYNRELTPAEVALASQQMAWCQLNPDWSAWGCRRRYYYAPSAAGFQAAWAARANRLLGGGADRV